MLFQEKLGIDTIKTNHKKIVVWLDWTMATWVSYNQLDFQLPMSLDKTLKYLQRQFESSFYSLNKLE